MGHYVWRASLVGAAATIVGLGTLAGPLSPSGRDGPAAYESAYARAEIGTPKTLTLKSTGSALAAAAFGLSALQPETYNGQIVLELIDASPLERGEKLRLAANLLAAERGKADLDAVLTDVRVSLAIE